MKAAFLLLLATLGMAEDKHHFSGMARVTGPSGTVKLVAAQMEDFDPMHTPGLGAASLYRLRLTPEVLGDFSGLPMIISASCAVQVSNTAAGHWVSSFCGWKLDFTPADRLVTLLHESFAGQSATSVQSVLGDSVDGSLELTFR